MNDDEIRLFLLKNRVRVQRLSPSDMQLEVLNFVRLEGWTRTGDVSISFDISKESACYLLRTLWQKGYCKRVNTGDVTGGNEFKYKFFLEKESEAK